MSDQPETPATPTHPFAAFFGGANPFFTAATAHPLFGGDAFRKGMADHLARVQAVTDEVVRVEAQGMAHARSMIDESAKLAQETLGYATQMSAEWRRMMFEAARQSFELVNPGKR